MRRLFLIAGLMTGLGLAVVAASAFAPANFAGTWSLDKAKSQGLDPRMQNAESVTWTITQDDKQISIDSKVVAGAPAAGAPTGPGGGGGMGGGGGRGPGGPRVYSLDGKEATTEAQGGSNTTKATWSGDGKALELSSVRTGSRDGNEFKFTTVEKLSLSGDGKVLTDVRHSESPRGAVDSTLVLNKQ
ncbi:MAG: hypothetical protein QOH41_1365 [Blastocatellia bacterium]|jgi:hypothetical protein|nr:hypothetical protein [Blastocatellia bacterium]